MDLYFVLSDYLENKLIFHDFSFTNDMVDYSYSMANLFHPGQLYSLAIVKQILLDTYKECYHIRQESELLQLHTEEAELLSLF